MVHETKPASGIDNRQGRAADEEIEEIEIPPQKTLIDGVAQIMDKFASTRVGQMMIEKTDRVLKVLEETARWSLPPNDNDEELKRPLPWFFFLILIIGLRVYRIWYSCAATIVRFEALTPEHMVYYFQSQRRHLRALRIQGLKLRKSQEIDASAKHSANRSKSFMSSLANLFSSVRRREVPPVRRVLPRDGKHFKVVADEDSAVHNLTVSEMLDKYAKEDSDNDSDYVPQEDDDGDEDDYDSMSSHETTASAEEVEEALEEKSSDYQEEVIESPKHLMPEKEITKKIKENGEKKPHSKAKPLDEIHHEIQNNADSENEQMHTPKEIPQTNGTANVEVNHKTPVMTPEVAPSNPLNTPKVAINLLAAPQFDESNKKSTPGHETAASLKTHSTKAAETGSLQDFHSIFHPAPIVKGSPGEVKTSTPVEAVSDKGASSVSTENQPFSQKKNFNHSSHHNHNQHPHHNNAKNRFKNRR